MRNWKNNLKKYAVRLPEAAIGLYQKTLSPRRGFLNFLYPYPVCRFHPSCSDYALDSFRQYGLLKGGMLSLKRIIKCNPFGPGGHDPVK